MTLTIKNELIFSNLWQFAEHIKMSKLKKWAISKYNLTQKDWNAFRKVEKIFGESDTDVIND